MEFYLWKMSVHWIDKSYTLPKVPQCIVIVCTVCCMSLYVSTHCMYCDEVVSILLSLLLFWVQCTHSCTCVLHRFNSATMTNYLYNHSWSLCVLNFCVWNSLQMFFYFVHNHALSFSFIVYQPGPYSIVVPTHHVSSRQWATLPRYHVRLWPPWNLTLSDWTLSGTWLITSLYSLTPTRWKWPLFWVSCRCCLESACRSSTTCECLVGIVRDGGGGWQGEVVSVTSVDCECKEWEFNYDEWGCVDSFVHQFIVGILKYSHFKNYLNIVMEFVPQVLFLLCIFGWLVFLIFFKWCFYYEDLARVSSHTCTHRYTSV